MVMDTVQRKDEVLAKAEEFFAQRGYHATSVRDIAEALFLTRRTIWGIVGDLRKGGMIHVRKEGRRHHYSLNFDARLRHPIFEGHTVISLLQLLAARIPAFLAARRP